VNPVREMTSSSCLSRPAIAERQDAPSRQSAPPAPLTAARPLSARNSPRRNVPPGPARSSAPDTRARLVPRGRGESRVVLALEIELQLAHVATSTVPRIASGISANTCCISSGVFSQNCRGHSACGPSRTASNRSERRAWRRARRRALLRCNDIVGSDSLQAKFLGNRAEWRQ